MNPSDESKESQTSESSDAEATFTPSEKIGNQEQHSSAATFLKPWIVLPWWVRPLWEGHKFKDDSRFEEIKYERIDQYAKGYPRLAAFYNSDPDFRVFRRFGTLRNRLLLYRQHELVVLEKCLFDMDNTDSEKNEYRIQSIRKDKADEQSEREKLIDEIDCKLKQYDELLDRERNSMSLKKPRTRAYHSIINYYWNEKPIVKSETAFLNLADDFVILSGDQDSSFHSALERFIGKSRIKPLKNIFSTPGTLAKTDDPAIRLLDKTKLNYLAIAIAAVVSAILLMIPISLLFRLVVSERIKLAIVLLFSFLFHAVISYLTKPDNYQLFMATATYCAVLVAFLTSLTSNSSGKTPNG